jgi:RNA-directed DNA polymerase
VERTEGGKRSRVSVEEATQVTEATARRERWSWAEALIWTDRMLAALENGVKGDKWFSLMDKVYAPKVLRRAFEQVRRNRGASGVDRVSVERFDRDAEQYLDEISTQLRTGTYTVQSVRRVYIEKAGGGERPLGIPTVKDRVVQTALKLVLEPIFERMFRTESYGFRPGRSAKDALRAVEEHLKAGYTYVVDADLKSYFDTIPWDRLMSRVEMRVSDGTLLSLLRQYLEQGVVEGARSWTPTQGTPQGAVLSPLLANLYLHPMDEVLGDRYRLVRYADDFVILCRNQAEAEAALAELREWVAENGLTLHPEKTHVGDCRQKGQGFEFLGYRFESGNRWVRKKSWQKVRERIREETRRTRSGSPVQIAFELSLILRGWFGYFKHAHPRFFTDLDGFVRRRFRSVLRKRQKRPGHGGTHADHQRWPNNYFAKIGLFSVSAARQHARRSR